jgi:hypothetical protein
MARGTRLATGAGGPLGSAPDEIADASALRPPHSSYLSGAILAAVDAAGRPAFSRVDHLSSSGSSDENSWSASP